MQAPRTGLSTRIVDYEPRHHNAFRALNLAWITAYFTLEPADQEALDDPERGIIEPGGAILMAEIGGEVVGCCALLRLGPDSFELAKMAVAPAVQGKGIGELLGREAIARARRLGARRVELLSNTVLTPAIALYRKLGFVEAPLGATDYQRANIRMVLELAE